MSIRLGRTAANAWPVTLVTVAANAKQSTRVKRTLEFVVIMRGANSKAHRTVILASVMLATRYGMADARTLMNVRLRKITATTRCRNAWTHPRVTCASKASFDVVTCILHYMYITCIIENKY